MTSSYQIYKRLLSYLAPYWGRFVWGMLLMGISAGMEPLLPMLLKPLLDGEFGGGTGYPWMVGVGLVGLVIFRGVAGYGADYFMNWLSNQIVIDLRRQMFERIGGLPAQKMDAQHSSFIINKVMNDVSNVMGATTTVLTSIVRDVITLVGLMLWLIWLNWQLTVVFFLVVPLAGGIIRKFSQMMRRFSLRSMEINADLLQIMQEMVEGYRTVKIFGGRDYEEKRFEHAQRVWKKQQMRIANAQGAVVPVTQMIASVALAIVIVVATHQTAIGELTVGAMVSYLTAALMLMPAMRRLSSVSSAIQRGLAAAESVFALVDLPIEEDDLHGDSPPICLHQPLSGEIQCQQLNFYYAERDTAILHNINLHIQAGESIALVGASGAGKTSLVALLCGFYRQYQGSITFDGHELRQISLKDLRRNIAMVSQEVKLFDDTVRANIAYGELSGLSDSAIIAAATAAYAMEFINKLPQGLDTPIGERGLRLSGGQRQRLAIARALLKKAPILILDEATSALDNASERQVQLALERLLQHQTTIIIAHRLSTIRAVNRIVVMNEGRIVEMGNHESLLALNGHYARFCQAHGKDE